MFAWATTYRFGTVIQFTFATVALSLGAIDALSPMARGADREPQQERNLSGNPLWQIPIAALKVTQERPLFSLSRRPAPLAVIALQPTQPLPLPPSPAPPAEPDQPPLSLIGTILQDNAGIAIFQSANTDGVVRLKIGESYAGWSLAALKQREAIFNNGRRDTTLGFPSPATRQEPIISPITGAAPPLGWLNGAKVSTVSPPGTSNATSGPAPSWLNGAPVLPAR